MESVNYERVIADLESRRAAFNASIDSAISAIRAVLSAGSGTTTPAGEPVAGVVPMNGGTLTPDMLFKKSIPEAAIMALQVLRKPLTTKQIVAALEAASFHHQSQNFGNTVNSILHRRESTTGDVMKIGKTWVLAEWYPGRRRPRPQDEQTQLEVEETEA